MNSDTKDIPSDIYQTFSPDINDIDKGSDDGLSKNSRFYEPFKTSRVYKPLTSDFARMPLSSENKREKS